MDGVGELELIVEESFRAESIAPEYLIDVSVLVFQLVDGVSTYLCLCVIKVQIRSLTERAEIPVLDHHLSCEFSCGIVN